MTDRIQAEAPVGCVLPPSVKQIAFFRVLSGCFAAVVAGDVAAMNSRFGPLHSGHSGTSDIPDPMAGFKVLLTSGAKWYCPH